MSDESQGGTGNQLRGSDSKTTILKSEGGIVYFTDRIFRNCSIKNSETNDFRHAHLIMASGKNATFLNFDFRYALLEDCYFHEAHFERCNFIGAKIRRCNFRTATFTDCQFDYITIEETPIDYRQICKQLPGRPNVAREIIQSLRRNAITLGNAKEVRHLTLLEAEQEREHYRKARRGNEAYYTKKYGSFTKKINVRAKSTLLWMENFFLGGGEKLKNLIFSLILITLLLSIVTAAFDFETLSGVKISELSYRSVLYFMDYIIVILGGTGHNSSERGFLIELLLGVFRVSFTGMLVAYILRMVSRR